MFYLNPPGQRIDCIDLRFRFLANGVWVFETGLGVSLFSLIYRLNSTSCERLRKV